MSKEDTPPIRRINVHSDEPSAMSGMTTPNTATAAVRKRSSAYDDDDDDEPSPKKKHSPTFQFAKVKRTRLYLATILRGGLTWKKSWQTI